MNKLDLHKLLLLPLGKQIDQKLVEQWAHSFWKMKESSPIGAKKQSDGSRFVMMLPPPNITGNLHLGHALTAAIQDALIRQRQMRGKQATWIPGFDHAGLATQNIVEKLLWHREGKTRNEIGRVKFNSVINEWKETKLDEIKRQLDRLGLQLDYQREYFTMDDKSSQAVHVAFKRLFNSGNIYRQVKPVYWSNELQTTLSDIEVNKVDGIARYFRTGEIVERKPISQWFIDSRKMAMSAVDVVRNQSIDIIPPNYKRSWSAWLVENGVKDWCISRQSWWGHRIPAYKLANAADVQENWIIADSVNEAKEKLKSEQVVQDDDVLDTWFSSSLLPLTIAGWPDQELFSQSQQSGLFPLDIMETGFDILNYWVSKMVMISIALENKIPFKLILLHGMICDSAGKKMSKSKGNVIDPLNIINGASLESLQRETKNLHAQGLFEDEQLELALKNQEKLFPKGIPTCGADGLRAYLLSHDFQEEIVRIRIEQIDKVRRLSNKIWNIYRFILPKIEAFSENNTVNIDLNQLLESNLKDHDLQVLKALARCVIISHNCFDKDYQLHLSFNAIEFFWTIHLSSTYLQQAKAALMDEKAGELELQVITLCLVTATKLLHPFMPHATEFLYRKLSLTLDSKKSDLEHIDCLAYETFPEKEDWIKLLNEHK